MDESFERFKGIFNYCLWLLLLYFNVLLVAGGWLLNFYFNVSIEVVHSSLYKVCSMKQE